MVAGKSKRSQRLDTPQSPTNEASEHSIGTQNDGFSSFGDETNSFLSWWWWSDAFGAGSRRVTRRPSTAQVMVPLDGSINGSNFAFLYRT